MRKKNIGIRLRISLLQGMCFYSPIATLYRQAAGVGLFEMSVIESVSFILSLMLEVPWACLGGPSEARRFDKRRKR